MVEPIIKIQLVLKYRLFHKILWLIGDYMYDCMYNIRFLFFRCLRKDFKVTNLSINFSIRPDRSSYIRFKKKIKLVNLYMHCRYKCQIFRLFRFSVWFQFRIGFFLDFTGHPRPLDNEWFLLFNTYER